MKPTSNPSPTLSMMFTKNNEGVTQLGGYRYNNTLCGGNQTHLLQNIKEEDQFKHSFPSFLNEKAHNQSLGGF